MCEFTYEVEITLEQHVALSRKEMAGMVASPNKTPHLLLTCYRTLDIFFLPPSQEKIVTDDLIIFKKKREAEVRKLLSLNQ